MTALTFAGLVLCALLLVLVIWRFASRRISIPCPSWLASIVELENPLAREHRSGVIVERLGLRPGMKVLDVGCGPGRVPLPLARSVAPNGEVVAIDIQPGMIKRARENAQRADLSNIRFMLADVGTGRLERDRYDRAVLVTVLGEIPDRAAAVKEIFDALKPGGLLSVTEIMADPHYQGRATVLRFAAAAGFRERGFFGNRFAYTLLLEK